MKRFFRIFIFVGISVQLLWGQSAVKQTAKSIAPVKIEPAVKFDVSPPLRELAKRAVPGEAVGNPVLMPRMPSPIVIDENREALGPDPVWQSFMGSKTLVPTIQNFEGIAVTDNDFLLAPPDPNMDVGPNHVVQMVNIMFAIWDKSGNLLVGPTNNNALWSGFGGPCESNNDGDPIVLYDPIADRWVLSQFVFFANECIAVSTTPDPTGSYFRYQFSTPGNDYPKLGVMPDAYYAVIRNFSGAFNLDAVAFERDKMLAGQPAQMVTFNMSSLLPNIDGFLPSDLDGPAPAGPTPGYFLGHFSNNQLGLFEMNVDWNNIGNSTLTGPTTFTVPTYDVGLADIPQPNGQGLDDLTFATLHRLAFRDFGTYQVLMANHSVDVNDFPNHAGVRWYELRNNSGTWSVFQSGTYAPDSDHRWMGSIAMNQNGDIGLGYTVSSSTTFPSIRFTGRFDGDPSGVMTVAESSIIEGSGSQTGTNRWGDYSAIAVDPSDDVTFWYTHEYIQTTGLFNWQTRIGSFQLAGGGVIFPDIDVSPTSFVFNLPVGGTDTGNMTISNTAAAGALDLTYNITVQEPVVLDVNNQTQIQLQGSNEVKTGGNYGLFNVQKPAINDIPYSPVAVNSNNEAAVDLIIDDGTRENAVGLTTGGQFVWLNRFTPAPTDFPFTLQEVQILFGAGVGVNVGELVDIYLYEDTDGDGDPGTGANFLSKLNNAPVQFTDDVNFSKYTIPPTTFNGPGDVLIAVVNRTAGTNAGEFPAALDQSTTARRSWVGLYNAGNPADPPTFPADNLWGIIDDFGIPGNWMIRGFSEPAIGCDWLTVSPSSGTVPAGNSDNVTVSVDATGLPVGTYTCNLVINSNDPDENPVVVPVTLNVGGGGGVAFRINAGGSDFTDSNGDLFVADKAFTPGDFGYVKGGFTSFTGDVTGTTDDPLYLSVRGRRTGPFRYLFDNLPAGDYDVTLYFTEPFFTTAGQRVFDVRMETSIVLDDFDIVAASGGKMVAHTETVPITVNDGRLNVDFFPVTSTYAIVSAISVVQVTGGAAPPADDQSIAEKSASLQPTSYALAQNFPNPFNPETRIRYDVPSAAQVTLKVYDVLGREIRTLVNDFQQAGTYNVVWDALDNNGQQVPSGIYIYRLQGEGFSTAKKMTLLR